MTGTRLLRDSAGAGEARTPILGLGGALTSHSDVKARQRRAHTTSQ